LLLNANKALTRDFSTVAEGSQNPLDLQAIDCNFQARSPSLKDSAGSAWSRLDLGLAREGQEIKGRQSGVFAKHSNSV
jgi:hypothetical protein